MLTADDVREALRVCFDPELPVNLVDLGLLHDIAIAQDADAPGSLPRFHVTITLLRRTLDEQREAMLQAQVANRLAGLFAISRTTVEMADEPQWTAERISDEGRQALGLNRTPKPGLVQIQLGQAGASGRS